MLLAVLYERRSGLSSQSLLQRQEEDQNEQKGQEVFVMWIAQKNIQAEAGQICPTLVAPRKQLRYRVARLRHVI